MNDVKLTLVIPFYNTPESDFNELVNSIKTQTDINYIIIIIDDGSNIKSACMLDKASNNIHNCIVVHKQNEGVSAARNEGIAKCDTEYISFVDSDDILMPNYVECLNKTIEEFHPDIVVGGIKKEPIEDTPMQSSGKVEAFFGKEEISCLEEALLGVSPRRINYDVLGTPCARAYKTRVAKDIMFIDGLSFYEDKVFNRMFLKKANSAVVLPDILYIYKQNYYSAMHKNRNINFYEKTKDYRRILWEMNCQEKSMYRNALRKEQIEYLYGVINYDYIYSKSKGFADYNRTIKAMVEEPIIKDAIENLKLNTNVDGLMKVINLYLIRSKNYWLLFIEKKMVYYIRTMISLIKNKGVKK